MKKLLPLEVAEWSGQVMELRDNELALRRPMNTNPTCARSWTRSSRALRALQVYQAILESQASEHAARMVAMHNATDNAKELAALMSCSTTKCANRPSPTISWTSSAAPKR